MKNKIEIRIKDHRGNVVLETTNLQYKKDIEENKNKLTLYWGCYVSYHDGKEIGYDRIENQKNGRSPRRLITVNNKNIFAEYTISTNMYKKNYADILLEYLEEDFGGYE